MMNKIKIFIADCIEEIRYKVSWPSYKSLQDSSALVLVASIIFAVVVGVIDLAFRNAVSWFYNIF
jgi:preprotein translocase subunit SecE